MEQVGVGKINKQTVIIREIRAQCNAIQMYNNHNDVFPFARIVCVDIFDKHLFIDRIDWTDWTALLPMHFIWAILMS